MCGEHHVFCRPRSGHEQELMRFGIPICIVRVMLVTIRGTIWQTLRWGSFWEPAFCSLMRYCGDVVALKALRVIIDIRMHRPTRVAHDQVVGIDGQWRRVMATLQWSASMPALRVRLLSPVNEAVRRDAHKFASLLALLPHVQWCLEVPSAHPSDQWFHQVRDIYAACEMKGVSLALASSVSVLDGPFHAEKAVLSASRMHLIEEGGFWLQVGAQMMLPTHQRELKRLDFPQWFIQCGATTHTLRFPVAELPQCLGGYGIPHAGEDYFVWRECGACTRRSGCSGVPKRVALLMSDDSDVCPLPFWTGMVPNPRIAVTAKDQKMASVFMEFVRIWQSYGAVPCGPQDAPNFLLIDSLSGANQAITDAMIQSGTRFVIWDHSLTDSFEDLAKRFDPNGRRFHGKDWWPHPQILVLSTIPERIKQYREYGVPLRWIRFVHWPVRVGFTSLPCIADGWYQPQGNESNAVLRRQIEQAKFVVLDNVSGARLHEMLALSGGLGRVAIALSSPSTRFWIKHKHNGLLARSPADVPKLVEQLAADSQLLAELTLNARKVSRNRTMHVMAHSLFHGFS